MRLNHLVYATLIAMIFVGCKSGSNDALISGTIDNAGGKSAVLQGFANGKPSTLDSTKIQPDGSFSIPKMNIERDFYRLMIGDSQRGLLMVLDSTSNLQVSANADSLAQSWSVQGSADTELLLEFTKQTDEFKVRMDSMLKANQDLRTSRDIQDRQKLRALQQELMSEYQEYVKSFVDNNTSSAAALVAVNNLDVKSELDYFRRVRDELKDKLGESAYWENLDQKVAQAEQRAEAMEKFEPGKPAPNIELKNTEGNVVSLESLEGKVVLVDFWASWCKPCRRENPNVKRVYNRFKDQGFEIYGVSLDKKRDKWLQAIEQDGLPWVHVSDLKGWQSAAADLYQVRSIPYTVLVDKEGKIIETGLRGKKLEEKLAEIFPKS